MPNAASVIEKNQPTLKCVMCNTPTMYAVEEGYEAGVIHPYPMCQFCNLNSVYIYNPAQNQYNIIRK